MSDEHTDADVTPSAEELEEARALARLLAEHGRANDAAAQARATAPLPCRGDALTAALETAAMLRHGGDRARLSAERQATILERLGPALDDLAARVAAPVVADRAVPGTEPARAGQHRARGGRWRGRAGWRMLVPSLGGAAVAVAAGIALLLLGEQGPITGRQPQPVRLGSTVLPRPGLSLLQAQAQLAHSSARAERTPSSAAFERQMREYRADMLVALARRYATRGRER